MRINLVTPFAEKDAAKALGARWDAAKKQWYVVDVADLTPFMRWIPDLQAASQESAASGTTSATSPGKPPAAPPTSAPKRVVTTSSTAAPACGYKVLPWDDCQHTGNARA